MRAALASSSSATIVTARWLLRGLGRRWIIAVGLAALAFAWRAGDDAAAGRAAWIEFVELFGGAFAVAIGASALGTLRGGRRAGPLEGSPVVGPAWLCGVGLALGTAVCALALVLSLAGVLAHRGPLVVTAPIEPPSCEGIVRWIGGEAFAAGSGGEVVWRCPAPPPGGRWALETRLRVVHHRVATPGLAVTVTGPGIAWRGRSSPERPLVVPLPDDFAGGRLVMRSEDAELSFRVLPAASVLRADERAAPSRGWLRFGLTTASRALLLLVVALALSILTAPPIAAAGALTCWAAGWVAPFLRDLGAHSIVPSIVRARVEVDPAAVAGRTPSTWFIDWVPDLRSGAGAERLARGLVPTWPDVGAEVGPRLLLGALVLVGAALVTVVAWRRTVSRKPGEGWAP